MVRPSSNATRIKSWLVAAGLLAAVVLLLFQLDSLGDLDDLSDGLMKLPPELSELSGMVALDDKTLACVQDEVGAVFVVDLSGEQPVRRVKFGRDGDYEGIAKVGEALWVLRSDGSLQQLAWSGKRLHTKDTFKLPFDGEFEGLCLDSDGDNLLVLPKGPVDGKSREKDRRRILAFHLLLRSGMPTPVVTLKVEKIEDEIEKHGLPGPRRTTAKGKIKVKLELYGSELLALPGGDLLMLSPKDRLLLRVDRDGHVVATQGLDMNLLPQPEAMALLPDGRLLIGSEGHGRPALIAVVAIPE